MCPRLGWTIQSHPRGTGEAGWDGSFGKNGRERGSLKSTDRGDMGTREGRGQFPVSFLRPPTASIEVRPPLWILMLHRYNQCY